MKAEPESRIEVSLRNILFSSANLSEVDHSLSLPLLSPWPNGHMFHTPLKKHCWFRTQWAEGQRCKILHWRSEGCHRARGLGWCEKLRRLVVILLGSNNPTKWRPARNNMRVMMKGDLAFFYHSNCKVPGIVGTMEIVREHSDDGKPY